MKHKTIAIRLHPRLESEGRGLCDPEDPRNSEVITHHNYGPQGYLIVHPSGFIRAQIRSGTLIEIPVKRHSGPQAGTAVKKASPGSRKTGKAQS